MIKCVHIEDNWVYISVYNNCIVVCTLIYAVGNFSVNSVLVAQGGVSFTKYYSVINGAN